MTSLERKWENRLAREGMPNTLRPLETNVGRYVDPLQWNGKRSESADSVLAKWTLITHLVNALPLYFHNRHLLVTLCETGYVTKTARIHKVSSKTVYRAMQALTRVQR